MSSRVGVLAVVQAGGQGSRMDVLTRERAKPALPFAGGYRLIDFALSSLSHSGIPDVWLSVQYQAASLDPHVSGGRPWDLDRTRGGFRRFVPELGAGGAQSGFASGNADDLLRMRDEIERSGADVVVVLSADHVFSLDLSTVVDEHVAHRADCTLVTTEVTRTEARHHVVVHVGEGGTVEGVEVKPGSTSRTTIAAEIFVYRVEALLEALDELRRELSERGELDGEGGLGDFGEHLLPHLIRTGRVRAFPLTGYWKDVGRPETYLAAHRDLIAGRVDVLHDADRPVMTRSEHRVAGVVHAGAQVEDSVVGLAADVRGRVVRSVLGPGVVVRAGALVQDSVLLDDVVVEAGAQVRTSVVDEGVVVGRGARVGAAAPSRNPRDKDIALVGRGSRITGGAVVGAGARVEPGSHV